jgi:hypothetical protein
MPHLLIERLRSFPALYTCTCNRKEYPSGAYAIEVLDILAGIIFIVGSACFLPQYSHSLNVFLAGCILFVVGSVIYVVICVCTFIEALCEKGLVTLEAAENGLYLLGSWLFLFGTFLYWPSESHYAGVKYIQNLSLAQYFNLFEPELEGTLLFIAGSVLFAFAAFFNALNQREFDEWASRLLPVITSLYLGGSLLFAMGSVAFLPHLGCSEQMVEIGAWQFIIGSILFLIGGCLSFWRTVWISQHPPDELAALKP